MHLRALEAPGTLLTQTGGYQLRISLGSQVVPGHFDVALAAIDDRERVVLTERWERVVLGQVDPNGWPSLPLDMTWTFERPQPVGFPGSGL